MSAALMIGVLAVVVLLVAASLRLPSLASSLLSAYVVLVAITTVVTTALSPFRWVTTNGIAGAEAVLLALASGVWWLRGCPRLPFAAARAAVREVFRDPIVTVLLGIGLAVLAYELLLVLTVPANNWDSLWYHLARVAAWVHHGGVYWIPHAPTDNLNEFPRLAEQEILYLFVAARWGALFALPQFLAELAILLSIYTSARRLGHSVAPSACAVLLFAMLSLVALESTTAQNDLVAASFPIAAVALLLGGTAVEVVLAGIAVALGVGVKLTTLPALPVVVALVVLLGRRKSIAFGVSAALGFATLGMWSFVTNVAETGRLLGHGGGRVEVSASPTFPGSVSTAFRVSYRLLDLSGFRTWMIWALAGAAAVAAVAAVVRERSRRSVAYWLPAGGPAVVLLAPALVIGIAWVLHLLVRLVHLPVGGAATTSFPFTWTLNRATIEDYSGFGPIAVIALLGLPAVTISAAWRRRTDIRHLVLALALPLFVVALALSAKYNPYLLRFLIIPVALTAPLFAMLFRRRLDTAAIFVVAGLSVGLALVHDQLKPLHSGFGRPWQLTQVEAVTLTWKPAAGEAADTLDRLASGRVCLGAVLGSGEPTYLLWGPRLERRVTFLPRDGAPQAAEAAGVPDVVIGDVDMAGVAEAFKNGGWSLQPLSATSWTLATSPKIGSGWCGRAT